MPQRYQILQGEWREEEARKFCFRQAEELLERRRNLLVEKRLRVKELRDRTAIMEARMMAW